MFDKTTYNSEFLKARKELDNLRQQWFDLNVAGKENKAIRLIPKIEKAERKFAYEHDKYCDKYGLNNLKITENWSKFWNK